MPGAWSDVRCVESLLGANGDGLVAVEWGGKKPSVERANGCGLSVVLGSGREIAVNTGFDAATLLRLVEVLERL